jgi:hypothetical protein
MKEINYRGGIVCFRLPETWREEYEDAGGGTFYVEKPGSGTLRLNVIDSKKPADAPDAKSALLAFMDRTRPADSSLRIVGNGNILCRYTKPATEDGEELVMHYWEIGNAVGSTQARLALFSFSVPASAGASEGTLRDGAMLEEELAAAELCEHLGDLPALH